MERNTATSDSPAISRRDLVRGVIAYPLMSYSLHRAQSAHGAESDDMRRGGMIIRQKNPDNLEFPFSSLDTSQLATPNDLFYVRTHFEEPKVDAKTWRLKVEGAVDRPFELGLEDLRAMPSKTETVLLECAGNGRIFLPPTQVGLRWGLGGVSTAEWTGVPLAAILERAGVKQNAVEVIIEGADQGEYREPLPRTPGVIPYARSLPLSKATASEVLLAHTMNGHPLPARHGFPVRVVVAGWYGMASVKWLKRIIVSDQPFNGYFQTFMYTTWQRRNGLPTLAPVMEIEVKAQIARPAPFEQVPRESKYRIFGAAWAGEAHVSKVEVSDDGGRSWTLATLLDKPVQYAWRYWEHDWKTPSSPGRATLMARATDTRGRTQPDSRDADRRDGVVNHVIPIEVEIG